MKKIIIFLAAFMPLASSFASPLINQGLFQGKGTRNSTKLFENGASKYNNAECSLSANLNKTDSQLNAEFFFDCGWMPYYGYIRWKEVLQLEIKNNDLFLGKNKIGYIEEDGTIFFETKHSFYYDQIHNIRKFPCLKRIINKTIEHEARSAIDTQNYKLKPLSSNNFELEINQFSRNFADKKFWKGCSLETIESNNFEIVATINAQLEQK